MVVRIGNEQLKPLLLLNFARTFSHKTGKSPYCSLQQMTKKKVQNLSAQRVCK